MKNSCFSRNIVFSRWGPTFSQVLVSLGIGCTNSSLFQKTQLDQLVKCRMRAGMAQVIKLCLFKDKVVVQKNTTIR